MTVVTLSALETLLGAPGPISRGAVVVDYWAGTGPYIGIVGADVTFPETITIRIVDGEPVEPVDLPATDGLCCVRWVIRSYNGGGAPVERFTTIPDEGPVDFGDLPVVDPDTFLPLDPVPPSAMEILETATEAAEAAAESADEAAGSAEAAAASAASTVNVAGDVADLVELTDEGRLSEDALSATIDAEVAPDFAHRPTPGNGFVALGDSFSTTYNLAAAGAGFGAAWPHMACALSAQRLAYAGNAGVSGQNSTQILARVPDAIALNPRVVTVLAGTNDLTQGVTFAVWSGNIRAIVSGLRAAGIRVVLCTIPPRGNTTYLANNLKWNRWLRKYALANGLDLLDFFALLVDPATGIYKSGYDSGDALHPSQAAHVVMANYVAANLPTGPYSPVRALLVSDPGNLIANPLLTAGTPTPTSWSAGGSGSGDWTNGLVTDSDFAGKAWEIAFASAASASNFRTFTSFQFTGWSVGDVLEFSMKEKVTVANGITPSGTAGLRWRLDFTNGTTASVTPIGADSTVHAAATHMFRYTVPPGTTAIQIAVVVGIIPIAADFTVRVGEFGVYNLTTESLLTP